MLPPPPACNRGGIGATHIGKIAAQGDQREITPHSTVYPTHLTHQAGHRFTNGAEKWQRSRPWCTGGDRGTDRIQGGRGVGSGSEGAGGRQRLRGGRGSAALREAKGLVGV